jgi:hypothetical protein
LEAIQSLQEIMELKKEMGSIKHSYDPVNIRLDLSSPSKSRILFFRQRPK